ncbi:hypothetical protein PGT21_017641 [Puccinia graminis f. sp. tritici]|uniref:Uncharacterized protein n=1 Tax=Puccinia graminis f. sp. tritici TaxID=56615 RepID=A0A5B0M3J9_PUCGR|nr:hypothetical protein PGT21_017641 [Puccinia graminis f. sp. tritici]
MGRVEQAVELAQVCVSHRSWPDQPVSPPDAIRSGCRFGWNGQPTAIHTGDCRPAAQSLTVRGQAVIKCHLDTRPPDDSPPDPCTTDGLPRPSPSSLRQYDPSFSQDIQPGLHLQLWVQISRTDDSNAVDLTAENGRADSKARESIISGPLMALRYLLDVGGLSSGHPHPDWWTWVNTPTTPTPWLQSCQFDVGRQEGLAGSAEVVTWGFHPSINVASVCRPQADSSGSHEAH